jgi:hypothetical protein
MLRDPARATASRRDSAPGAANSGPPILPPETGEVPVSPSQPQKGLGMGVIVGVCAAAAGASLCVGAALLVLLRRRRHASGEQPAKPPSAKPPSANPPSAASAHPTSSNSSTAFNKRLNPSFQSSSTARAALASKAPRHTAGRHLSVQLKIQNAARPLQVPL